MDFGFFGIGAWELLVIGLLALIFLGPKQMIVLARKAGEMLRQFQQVWQEASKTIDREIRVIEQETGDLGGLGKEIQSLANEVKSSMTINVPSIGGAARPKDRVPAPPPSDPSTPSASRSAWAPAPPTTGPASPASNEPTGQPDDPPNTQSPGRPAARPETRYPAWTSKPEN